MKVVVDVLGAPENSGGMRLYAEELVSAWAENHPGDRLYVIGGQWITDAFTGSPSVATTEVGDGEADRILGQWLGAARLARRIDADVLLSVSLVVTPFGGKRRPTLCVVHDWRHLKHPQEFSRLRRAYRRLWVWSVGRASRAIQISEKTDAETAIIAPRARRVVIENGRDHARRWPPVDREAAIHPRTVLTYGHHSNKRPDLVIRAVAKLGPAAPRLVVLGAVGDYATELEEIANDVGLEGRMELPGFVAPEQYRRAVQQCSVIVLASSDEGFGLPVAEANFFGIPVVTTNDNGLQEIHPGRLLVADPSPDGLATAIAQALEGPKPIGSVGSIDSTWADAAAAVRALAQEAIREVHG